MNKIFDDLNCKIYSLSGVNDVAIKNAESILKIAFSNDYKRYLKEYGVVSLENHELMGLGGDEYLDVVKQTAKEKNSNSKFPADCYVLENLYIDGILILQNQKGEVFQFVNNNIKKINNNLREYIETLI